MISLQVIVGPGVAWHFLFKHKDVASDAVTGVLGETEFITIKDDFGTEALIRRNEFKGCLMEDLDEARAAQLERILNDQRLRAKAQQMIQADPQLRNLQHASSNVPIHMPMMR